MRYLFIWLFLLLLCCEKEPVVTAFRIQQDFQHLVDSFRVEAKRQGVSIAFDNLILEYDEALDSDVCGQCNALSTSASVQKIVGISRNNHCWDHAEELEALIFHELGHCLLARDHVTDTLPNGDPKSLMVPGNLTLYAPCKYVFGTVDCNNLHKRSYYLQELFDPETPIPDWAK